MIHYSTEIRQHSNTYSRVLIAVDIQKLHERYKRLVKYLCVNLFLARHSNKKTLSPKTTVIYAKALLFQINQVLTSFVYVPSVFSTDDLQTILKQMEQMVQATTM